MTLGNIEKETRVGLSSISWVRCASCGDMNNIYTSKTHEQKKQGLPIFHINAKLATGLINSGLSVVSVQLEREEVGLLLRIMQKRSRAEGVYQLTVIAPKD